MTVSADVEHCKENQRKRNKTSFAPITDSCRTSERSSSRSVIGVRRAQRMTSSPPAREEDLGRWFEARQRQRAPRHLAGGVFESNRSRLDKKYPMLVNGGRVKFNTLRSAKYRYFFFLRAPDLESRTSVTRAESRTPRSLVPFTDTRSCTRVLFFEPTQLLRRVRQLMERATIGRLMDALFVPDNYGLSETGVTLLLLMLLRPYPPRIALQVAVQLSNSRRTSACSSFSSSSCRDCFTWREFF